jgi:hypothetical protein
MATHETQHGRRPDPESRDDRPDAFARPDTALAADGMHQALPERPAPFAAAVYPAKKGDRKGLARFVESLKKSNVRVGGILQEKIDLGDNGMGRVEAINIATGQRTSINKPTSETSRSRDCSLDLTDQILQGIAAGIPLLIAVPESNLDVWTECSGGMGDVLPFDETAFHGWWVSVQGERAQRDIPLSP